MSNQDSSALATYNSLIDPHLQCYFSNERIRSHLKHAGLISRRGEIISDSEYRLKLARRDNKKHVRQMLAENIVHRAIDMERLRQAELRRQIDMVAKAALVNSVKESRRRPGYSLTSVMRSNEMGGPSIHSSWSQHRPASANYQREIQILNEELSNQPRTHSAHLGTNPSRRHISKSPLRRSRNVNRAKSTVTKSVDPSPTNPPCKITMIYYGTHSKIDYDQSLFEPIDEIQVMQQHCGGENLIVYKGNLRPGQEFSFNSRRHHEFPFGLSLYVKGLIDSRISTCCEYKHRHGVKLGGERGHFAIVSVEGSKPCIKCRFEKQSQLKQISNETDDENNDKPITISIPVDEKMKSKTKSVQIPVRHSSQSNENYSEDFDEPEQTNDKVRRRSKSPSETSSTSTEKSTKTWQIIFHTSNIPTASLNLTKKSSTNAHLIFSFIGFDENERTEEHQINLDDFSQCFKSGKQDSFKVKLTNVGKPKQIQLKVEVDQQTKQDIKWHLDHIEIIDPEDQSRSKFPCKQWIRPFEQIVLNQSDSSRSSSINKQSTKISSRSSSSSSYEAPNRVQLVEKSISHQSRRISTDNESNTQANFTPFQVIIYPSDDVDGEFNPFDDSKIFLRLNNQTKNTYLHKTNTKQCPAFQPSEQQTFDIQLRINADEQPQQLTIGFYNSDITAGKWKINKIILINKKTNQRSTFLGRQTLVRNDFNLRAEQTFQVENNSSDDDDDQQNTPRNTTEQIFTHKRSSSNESDRKTPTKQSTTTSDDENSSSRPKTRRGRDQQQSLVDQQNQQTKNIKTDSEIWRPSSQLEQNQTNRTDSTESQDEQFKNWYPNNTQDED